MDYRQLGRTDLHVSAIALGTMTWGEQNSETEAFAQIERAKAAGINFLDTAEMYPVPPKADINALGVEIIGDMPIYVSQDSSDAWSRTDLFEMDEDSRLLRVAGVPPDYFTADGQLWGNPLYRWDLMEKDNFAWWIDRIRTALTTVDVVRIDHFRGFESYWAVTAGEPTARNGQWEKARR